MAREKQEELCQDNDGRKFSVYLHLQQRFLMFLSLPLSSDTRYKTPQIQNVYLFALENS